MGGVQRFVYLGRAGDATGLWPNYYAWMRRACGQMVDVWSLGLASGAGWLCLNDIGRKCEVEGDCAI